MTRVVTFRSVIALSSVAAFGTVVGVIAMIPVSVLFMQHLGLLPIMTLAGNGGKKQSGGEDVEKFHLPPDVSRPRPLTSLNPRWSQPLSPGTSG
ncbi:hypothetical protein [Haloferula helveola]|uniref:hypothetical protein n=1 Tax=Haloferula helveola TaxID=490095 RepID=UPI00333E78A0